MLTWNNTGDPCAPETLTFVNHLMPTRIGYTTALGPYAFTNNNTEITMATNTGYSPRGLCYFDATGTQQLIFTLSNKIFRYPNNTDISRAVAYTNGYFSFAQYRDKIYAVNGADLLQKSTTGAFADVATTPKLTRIAVNGEYLAGINLVADFASTAPTVTASAYRLMISAVGNPEQFDTVADTTAWNQDIVNTGGPLTGITALRDFFVVFQKSGVYVVQSTGNPSDPWAIRLVSDYYGCEWPDSVIEVNNVLYWISPTRSGEVCAFDGSQITVLSQALQSTIVDSSTIYYSEKGFTGTTTYQLKGGLTAATDGETITWCRMYTTEATDSIVLGFSTLYLYLNIATGRFGTSGALQSTSAPFGVFSNAWQNAMLTIIPTQISNGANKFKAAYLAPFESASGRAEFYRGGDYINKITNSILRFSEYNGNDAINNAIAVIGAPGAVPKSAYNTSPTLKWMSTQRSGDAISKPEAFSLSTPSGTWNTTTGAFDMPSAASRSVSAKTFGFVLNVQPINSLTGIAVTYAPAGSSQVGAKAGTWL